MPEHDDLGERPDRHPAFLLRAEDYGHPKNQKHKRKQPETNTPYPINPPNTLAVTHIVTPCQVKYPVANNILL
ncbi:hypothetical protein, partial [Curtobacterium sp. CT11-133]|uniref:hypothetical protein n=1 Tax=Curtobacterium sp. CT11-133 TaxID=3243014 RepID=UPI0039B0ED39